MDVPFSSLNQPAPDEFLAKYVPPGTVFTAKGTGVSLTIAKVYKHGRYSSTFPVGRAVNKIHIRDGVPTINDRLNWRHALTADANKFANAGEYKLEAAKRHILGRYFWHFPSCESVRIRNAILTGTDVLVYGYAASDNFCVSGTIIFVYPNTKPQICYPKMSLRQHAELSSSPGGISTWIRDFTRETAIAIILKRNGIPPEITLLILEHFWK